MSRSTARGWACGGSPRRLAPCENQAPGQRRSSLQQVFDTDRQIAYAYAGGVVDRAGDGGGDAGQADFADATRTDFVPDVVRSEEHTSELQSLMRISYAVFCLKKNKNKQTTN